MDINNNFSSIVAKKIFANKDNAIKYLIELDKIKSIGLKYNTNSSGNKTIKMTTEEIWNKVVETWNTKDAGNIIREIFTQTDKFKSGKDSINTMKILLDEWHKLKLGEIAWPFSQGDFDNFVQRINAEKTDGNTKDNKVKEAAVKFRRIKEINTVRNDYIETLIFEKNENIIPTLNHRKNVDFFINGISYDQKVAKSPTKQFIKQYGDNWKKYAIDNPKVVAEYLYKYQDEGRFAADSRLLVVYLDENVTIERINSRLNNTQFNEPLEVNFTYIHSKNKSNESKTSYKVKCFIILLHN